MNLVLDPSAFSPELALHGSMHMDETNECAVCGKSDSAQLFSCIPDMCDRCFSVRDDMIRYAVERLYSRNADRDRETMRIITQSEADDFPAFLGEDIQMRDLVMAEW